ncbi:MAG TPA: hypothetical protein VHV99_26660, partial [Paraburkholderia sp.]|nr:hypothetical protein [Paraburkholderia sp.]
KRTGQGELLDATVLIFERYRVSQGSDAARVAGFSGGGLLSTGLARTPEAHSVCSKPVGCVATVSVRFGGASRP